MSAYVSAVLIALPLGALYALQGSGIVLVYRTTKVFNFAQAGIGVVAAYLAAWVAAHAGNGRPGAYLGAVVGIAVAAALGVLVEVTSIRWTRGALQRTVVTLGWLLALQSLVVAIFGQPPTLAPAQLFGTGSLLTFPGTTAHYSIRDVAVLLVAGGVALTLGGFLSRSAFGVAMRAVADDPEAGALLGLPVSRVLVVTWALGGAVAGLAGVLIAPILGSLDTYSLFLVTVQAIAAALVARLASLPLAFAGGLLLAVLQGLGATAFPAEARHMPELVGFLVVLAAVVLTRRQGRADVSAGGLLPVRVRPLPTRSFGLPALGVVVVVFAVLPLSVGAIGRSNISQIVTWAIAALSVVLLTGVAGQVSVCQCVFMGVGSVVAATAYGGHVPFLLSVLIGAAAAALAAVLVGIPALRLEPIELAIVTVAFGFSADGFLFTWQPFVNGHTDLARPPWIESSQKTGELHYAWLVLGVFLLLAVGVALLRRGRTGAALTALRSSAAATSAMGFSVTGSKLVGFAASGAIAGIAGALFSAVSGTVSVGQASSTLSTTTSITLLAYAIIAGVGNVPAALVGGLLVVLPTISQSGTPNPHVFGVINLASGLLLVAVVVLLPQGVASLAERIPRLASLRRAVA